MSGGKRLRLRLAKLDERVELLADDLDTERDEKDEAVDDLRKLVENLSARLRVVEARPRYMLIDGFRRYQGMKDILACKDKVTLVDDPWTNGALGYHELDDFLRAPVDPREADDNGMAEHPREADDNGMGELGFRCKFCRRCLAMRLKKTHMCKTKRDAQAKGKRK